MMARKLGKKVLKRLLRSMKRLLQTVIMVFKSTKEPSETAIIKYNLLNTTMLDFRVNSRQKDMRITSIILENFFLIMQKSRPRQCNNYSV